MEYYRGENFKKNKKSKLIIKTNNAITSLREVEKFLHHLKKGSRYVHLYKFLK